MASNIKVYEKITSKTYYLNATEPNIPNEETITCKYDNFRSKEDIIKFINIRIDEIINERNGDVNRIEIKRNGNNFEFSFSSFNECDEEEVLYECLLYYSI